MVKKVVMIAIAVVLALAGVMAIVNSQKSVAESVEASTLTKSDFKEDGIYRADKIYIVSSYAQRYDEYEAETLENSDTLYASIMIPVKDDKYIMGSMTISTSHELYDKFKKYLADESQEVGDLVISGYLKCLGDISTGERYNFYSEYALQETLLLDKIDVLYKDFSYLGETEEDMEAAVESNKNSGLIAGIVFIVIAVALVLIAVFVIKKKPPVPPVPPMYNQPYDPSQWQPQGGQPNYNQPYTPPAQPYQPYGQQQPYVPQQPYTPPQQAYVPPQQPSDGQQQPPYGQQ